MILNITQLQGQWRTSPEMYPVAANSTEKQYNFLATILAQRIRIHSLHILLFRLVSFLSFPLNFIDKQKQNKKKYFHYFSFSFWYLYVIIIIVLSILINSSLLIYLNFENIDTQLPFDIYIIDIGCSNQTVHWFWIDIIIFTIK